MYSTNTCRRISCKQELPDTKENIPFFNENQRHLPSLPLPLSRSGAVASGRYEVKMLGWNTPPEYMDFVNPYWKTFEAPNPFLHYMLGVFYIFFMFAALCGNGVVLWVFTSAKSLRTPSNMFVVNLALLDFIMMLKTPVFIINSFNEGPIWGKFGCDIFALMGSYSGISGAMTNAAIAYDRYKTIAKPFEPKIKSGTAFLMVLGTWAYATPWCMLPLFGIWGRFVPEGFLTTCSFDYLTEDENTRTFVAAIFFFSYIVPGFFIVFFYSQIFSHVRAHEKAMRAQAKKMNVDNLRSVGSKEDQEKSAEIRIAKVCMGLFFMFLVAWTPYAVVALIGAFGNRSILTPLVSMIPALCCKSMACIDPWVYAINHPKYRLELQKRMPWFCIHEEKPQDTVSQSSNNTEKA
ncbi:opsin, ultraviolet-sensitive-like isoform X1 [Penaeus monodon]|uniref:opsin, ultraviolet-sensitive-like isoform X1 n=1 Tax=Penaeus monodon TaxID=6687 RepID=UPI0018A72748|nr:opsin, ultraviolet-sensitive-like isoform X1 [Penaeus monodon]